MALKVEKSMEVKDFRESWSHIKALVEIEYEAVKHFPGGSYDLRLELIWGCEEEPCDEKDTLLG